MQAEMGDPPESVRERLAEKYGLGDYDVDVLINQGRAVVDYYTDLADACGDAKLAANWVQQDVLRELKERQWSVADYPVAPPALAELLAKVQAKELDTSRGREVLAEMVAGGRSAEQAIAKLGFTAVDEGELVALCRELLEAHPKIVEDLKNGVHKAAGRLIGEAKKRNANINPGQLRELCIELAQSM